MIRRPPITTRADTLFPYTTLFRSLLMQRYLQLGVAGEFALLDVVQLERRRHRGRCRRTIGGNGQGAGLGLGLRSGKERHLRISYTGLPRSEEHTSELQSLMRISYAVFCLKKKKKINKTTTTQ